MCKSTSHKMAFLRTPLLEKYAANKLAKAPASEGAQGFDITDIG